VVICVTHMCGNFFIAFINFLFMKLKSLSQIVPLVVSDVKERNIRYIGEGTNEKYYCINYPIQIYIDHEEWASVGHYLDVLKCQHLIYRTMPFMVYDYIIERKDTQKEWEDVVEYYMAKAQLQKCIQYAVFRDLLLKTENDYLIYRSYDCFWGDGVNSTGNNKLGLLLMKIRTELQKNKQDYNDILANF
jgi:hypothetical protein